MHSRTRQMAAIVGKDIQSVTTNKRMFSVLLIVPIVLTIFLPTIFIVSLRFAPQGGEELTELLKQFPLPAQGDGRLLTLIGLMLNYILPTFFLMIPVMASSVMAAGSFVGEKEKRTLETLLYCPLSLKEIFRAKVAASFLLSMFVSILSFLAMLAVIEAETAVFTGSLVLPDAKWLLVMLLVAPSLSLIAITLIVRVSAKAQSVEDAQQGAVFLVLPLILLIVGQFSGVLLINGWLMLAIGLVCAVLAAVLLKRAMGKFRYETLLQ